jgi:hypothetical protein
VEFGLELAAVEAPALDEPMELAVPPLVPVVLVPVPLPLSCDVPELPELPEVPELPLLPELPEVPVAEEPVPEPDWS